MTSGADLRAGISVDQVAAREFGKYTQLASLEVGLESAEVVGACESAYGCAYYNTISWRNDTTPLAMENRPRAIFERLFGDSGVTDAKTRAALGQEDRSTLDTVTENVRRLRGKLGGPGRGKLDQYLDAVRDVERRMQLAAKQGDQDVPQKSPVGTPPAPAGVTPDSRASRRLMPREGSKIDEGLKPPCTRPHVFVKGLSK